MTVPAMPLACTPTQPFPAQNACRCAQVCMRVLGRASSACDAMGTCFSTRSALHCAHRETPGSDKLRLQEETKRALAGPDAEKLHTECTTQQQLGTLAGLVWR